MYVEPFFRLVQAVPLHRWLVTRLPQWGPKFNSRQVHVGFAVEKVALGQAFFWIIHFFLSLSLHLCSIFIHLLLTLYNHSNWKYCWITRLKKSSLASDITVKFVFRLRIQVYAQKWPMLTEEIPRDICLSSTSSEVTTTTTFCLISHQSSYSLMPKCQNY
jgi:hypothetical protein